MKQLKVSRNNLAISFLLFSSLLLLPLFSYAQEEITLTTYYPAPYGVYTEMRAKRMAIGDNYVNTPQYCWSGTCTNTVNANADLIVEGNVGIGTATPTVAAAPNGVTSGNMDVNDVWLRGATPPRWASQSTSGVKAVSGSQSIYFGPNPQTTTITKDFTVNVTFQPIAALCSCMSDTFAAGWFGTACYVLSYGANFVTFRTQGWGDRDDPWDIAGSFNYIIIGQ